MAVQLCCAGSYGAISGAKIATRMKSTMMIRPKHRALAAHELAPSARSRAFVGQFDNRYLRYSHG